VILLRPLLVVLALAPCACVSQVTFDRSLADAAKAKADAEARHAQDEARIKDVEGQLQAVEAAIQERDSKLSDLSTEAHNGQAMLDEQTAINQQLRGELQRLGKDVDKVLADRGTLSKALEDARARLDELRKAQAAGEARITLFRDFERRFKPLVDGGQLGVLTRRGQLVIALAGDLLFETGHVELRTAGKGVLMEVARALQVSSSPVTGRRYLVTAHADPLEAMGPSGSTGASSGRGRGETSRPRRVKTAWELTAARAVAVVEYVISLGVPAESLTAAGAGSFDPLVPNDSVEARARNRRVEIALLPTAEETLPVALTKPSASP